MSLRSVISRNRDDIAFLVGNGINRYPNNPKALSWEDLLIKLWQKFSPDTFNEVPKGITTTEFYDLLDIANSEKRSTNFQIQKEASSLLESWAFQPHHQSFMQQAAMIGAPVLTTNFDLVLPMSLGLEQYYTETRGFTDFYPWTTYYGNRQMQLPTEGFGVWFINGFVKYHRSLRLGLTHYMGSVEKARNYLHRGEEKRLFSGKDEHDWRGVKTWLHIIFNKSLCIFGLGLEENEVFIRWLLIERAKYFKKFPYRRKKGWYVTIKSKELKKGINGKFKFLEGIGFEVVEVDDYPDIYQEPWE